MVVSSGLIANIVRNGSTFTPDTKGRYVGWSIDKGGSFTLELNCDLDEKNPQDMEFIQEVKDRVKECFWIKING